jgi:hypothetical protein
MGYRANIHALIAALAVVLACHVRGTAITSSADVATHMHLYKDILGSLELAASQASESKLASSIDVCLDLYAQVKMEAHG